MLKTRVEPIDDWVSIVVSEELAPEAKSKAIADFARGRLRDAQQTNSQVLGRVPPHETFVDGRAGAALEAVRPDGGTIVFEFEILTDVLQWIADTLRRRSPARSGRYRDSHRLFADGREIALTADLPPAAEYSFTNTVPYARKIEIGKTESGRDFVIQVEPRIYERTVADANARFGNVAKMRFAFRGVVGAAMVRGLAGNKSEARFPTITITPN